MRKVPKKLSQPQHALRLCKAARAWQKNSVKKRPPLRNLAKKLNTTTAQLKRLLQKPREKLRKATEKASIVRTVRRALSSAFHNKPHDTRLAARVPWQRSAIRMAEELHVTHYSTRTVQRHREPLMRARKKARAKKRKFAISLSQQYDPSCAAQVPEYGLR